MLILFLPQKAQQHQQKGRVSMNAVHKRLREITRRVEQEEEEEGDEEDDEEDEDG